MMRHLRVISGMALACGLAGCMVGPNYHKPALNLPLGYKTAPGWVAAQPADQVPKGTWWTAFNDPVLDRLEPLVAVDNQTLAADYYAYMQAAEIVQEERGQLFPSIGLSFSAQRSGSGGGSSSYSSVSTGGVSSGTTTTTGGIGGIDGTGATSTSTGGTTSRTSGTSAGTSGGTGITSTEIGNGPRTTGAFEGTIDWTPDIWGKIRRQVQSDVAAAQVSAADLVNATLSAQATLAIDYVDLRAEDANVALFRQTVIAYQETLRITQNQLNAGTVSDLDVITARAQLESAQANLINSGIARAQYEHAIAVLTGRAPSALGIPPATQIAAIPIAPPGLPSTLLERRPDIAAAERTMAEQNAEIGVAVGAYFPDISLSALGGYSADPIGGLFNVSNALWSLGADVDQTLFEGGIRSSAVSASRYAFDESVATYRETVLTGFQQVEDELVALNILAQQAVVEQAAVADAQRQVQISLNEYEAGTVTYTTVVTAQVALLEDQETALEVQQERLQASVTLIEALGGGFTESDLPSAASLQSRLPFAP